MTPASWFLRVGALLVFSAGCHAAGDIYRTVDAQGNVVYSDRAIGPTSKKITVDVIQGNAEDAARLAKESAREDADAAQQAKLAREQAAKQQQQDAQEALKQRRCQAARNRYAMFAAGGRISKVDEQGNRVYYSDAEIDAERISTKATMDAACSE
jgi:hypothetical protein